MANKIGRETLRGGEVCIFGLIFETLTSEQLAWLLGALLERVAAKGNRGLSYKGW